MMSRGQSFNSKNKRHPGEFPKHTIVPPKNNVPNDEVEHITTLEAFKNRVKE
jgi:hypothetical protein